MSRVAVTDFSSAGWDDPARAGDLAADYCAKLEAGGILYFDSCPFGFPEADRKALLEHRQSGLRFHKNISYRPTTGEIRGLSATSAEETEELERIMFDFSANVVQFVEAFLKPYAGNYSIDYASYRPVEEDGRPMSLHKRNDLLHVDAFPNRPTAGGRIMRVFVNMNPARTRDWVVSDGFDRLAAQYAGKAGLDQYARKAGSPFWKLMQKAVSAPRRWFGGLKGDPTPYDRFMHHFHNYLKENAEYQRDCPKEAIEFPPGSAWIVYTDFVPHAVLRGQFALEQTFIIHPEGMVTPEQAPVRILERLSGRRLVA